MLDEHGGEKLTTIGNDLEGIAAQRFMEITNPDVPVISREAAEAQIVADFGYMRKDPTSPGQDLLPIFDLAKSSGGDAWRVFCALWTNRKSQEAHGALIGQALKTDQGQGDLTIDTENYKKWVSMRNACRLKQE